MLAALLPGRRGRCSLGARACVGSTTLESAPPRSPPVAAGKQPAATTDPAWSGLGMAPADAPLAAAALRGQQADAALAAALLATKSEASAA